MTGVICNQQASTAGFDQRQYLLWCQLLERRTGVRVEALSRDWMNARIMECAADLAITDIGEYYRQLADQPDNLVEWNRLLDRLLVRDTRFFRHRESICSVGELWRQHQRNGRSGSFTAWSVGCSSGEEVYSLALTLEQNRLDESANFGVIGMDISGQAIAAARSGIYPASQLAELTPWQQDNYFERLADGLYQVNRLLKRRTCFIRGNVLDITESPQLQGADIIFCQNLLPYFRRWQRQQLVAKLAAGLKPGGHLIVGPGELANWQPPMLERSASRAVQIYRRGITPQQMAVPVRSCK